MTSKGNTSALSTPICWAISLSDFSLRALIHEQRTRYLAAVFAMVMGNGFLLLVPLLMKYALDTMNRSEFSSWTAILPYAIGIVVCQSLHGFFTYLRGRYSAAASEGIVFLSSSFTRASLSAALRRGLCSSILCSTLLIW